MSVVVKSALLTDHGFAHGFSLRTGGASLAPFDTLNLARSVGDDPTAVRENRRRFAEAVGYAPDALFEVSQVHGAKVRSVRAGDVRARVAVEEADALVACDAGLAVAVRVADCVPLLLADSRTGAVAAVHAGWRGIVARIADAAIARLGAEAGSAPADLLAAIGPHIRAGAFEVGADVALRIAAQAHGREVIDRARDKPHVDLTEALRAQLLAAGLRPEHVQDVGGCTVAEPARFFSFRRDGKRSGRHLGAVVARAG